MNKTSLLELAKRLNIPHRNCVKTKAEVEYAIKDTINAYKEIIFSSGIPKCTTCLNDTIRKLAWEGLQKNIVMNDETLIENRAGEVLGPEVDYTYYKNKF